MSRRAAILFVLALGLMAATAGFLAYARTHQRLGPPGVRLVAEPSRDEQGGAVGTQSVALPTEILGSKSEALPITQAELEMLPRDTTFGRRVYVWTNRPAVQLNVVLMGADRTSIHKPEYCLAGQGWEFRESEMEAIEVPMTKPVPYQLPLMKIEATRRFRAGEQEEVSRGFYLFWFVNDREISVGHTGRMWDSALHLLRTGELQRWAYIAVFASCAPGQESETLEWLKAAIAEAVPQFQLPPLEAPAGGQTPRAGRLE